MLERSASPDSSGREFLSFSKLASVASKSRCVEMHRGFAFLHYQVYNSGRLHLPLWAWPSETVKQNQTEGALQEPSLWCFCHKPIFSPISVAAVWSLLLLCFPLGTSVANNLHRSHDRAQCFIQRRQKRLSVSWGRNQAVYTAKRGHAGLQPALGITAQGRADHRGDRERRWDPETDLWISAIFDKEVAGSLGTAKIPATGFTRSV